MKNKLPKIVALISGFIASSMAERTNATMDYMPAPLYPSPNQSILDRIIAFFYNNILAIAVTAIVIILAIFFIWRKNAKSK